MKLAACSDDAPLLEALSDRDLCADKL